MAVKDKVKGICDTSKCNYDVYTSEKVDELLDELEEQLEDEVDELNDDVTDLKGTILFSGNETIYGGSHIITLSDNVSNYRYLEIFYYRNGGTSTVPAIHQESKKIDTSINMTLVTLNGIYPMGNGDDSDPYRILVYSQKVSIVGTQISFVQQNVLSAKDNGTIGSLNGADRSIFITKVIGYK